MFVIHFWQLHKKKSISHEIVNYIMAYMQCTTGKGVKILTCEFDKLID